MSHRAEPRPLLFPIVIGLALLLHVPLLVLVTLLMRPTDEPLPTTQALQPIHLIEEPDPVEADEIDASFVSLDKPEVETEPPEDARYLDRYNQKVEQEMVRKRDSREVGASGRPSAATPPPRPLKTAEQPKAATQPDPVDIETPEVSTPAPEADTNAPAAPLNLPNTQLDVQQDPAAPSTPSEPRDGQLDLDPDRILPNLDSNPGLGEGGVGEQSDWLKDVDEGDKDLLNRKESRYWTFFDRVRTSVGRQWKPNPVYRAHDPRGQIYGVEDRLTILRVTLKGDGSLQDLIVEKPCGLPFLDDEAVRAMRVAQPFPNPPEGLKDERGLISFRFGFMFEIQSSGGRIIRYNR